MAVLIVILIGSISFSRLPIDLYPDFEFPVVLVSTSYNGAGPHEVESMVTRNLESALSTVDGLESISSTSRYGHSEIILMFDWGVDMDFAALETREMVDLVSEQLPNDVGKPIVLQLNPNMMPIIQFGMSGDLTLTEMTEIAETNVLNQLERIEGVANVDIGGGYERQIEILVDPYKVNSYGLSYEQIMEVISASNLDVSGGEIIDGERRYGIRTLGEFQSIEEIEELIIGSNQGGPIKLKEVGRVNDINQEIQPLSRLNGEPTVSISVQKESDANTVAVSQAVIKEIQSIEETLSNVTFEVAMDQSEIVQDTIDSIVEMAIIGAILAMIILYLFLGNFKATIIVGLSIPISVIATFILVYFRGDSLNLLTLGGLALGIGMMVDSAIVILENIFRKRELGAEPVEGAEEGAKEVTGAIIAATLTTVAAFLPVVFVEGIAGLLFAPLSWTVTFSLIGSLVVAITVIPVLTVKLVPKGTNILKEKAKIPKMVDGLLNKLIAFYEKVLKNGLKRRFIVMLTLVGIIVLTVLLSPLVGFDFLPAMDTGEIVIQVELPKGSPISNTADLVFDIEDRISEVPEINNVFSQIGSGGNEEEATLNLKLVPEREREKDAFVVANEIREMMPNLPGVDFLVVEQDMAGTATALGDDIEIAIRGNSLETLEVLSEEIADIVRSVEGTTEVSTSFDEPRYEIQIELDRDRAQTFGVTPYHIGSFISLMTDTQLISFYREDGEEYNIRYGFDGKENLSIDTIQTMLMRTPTGDLVPIEELATLTIAQAPEQISRENQMRTGFVNANVSGRDLSSVMVDVEELMSDFDLPDNYFIDYAGLYEEMNYAFTELIFALGLGIILVYMVMAAQFESLLYPFIIMFTLPLTLIGVILSLLLTNTTLSIIAFVGIITLAGIVVNNGIVMVDYINLLYHQKGFSRNEAIIEAGKTRLRPILMTTLTTVLGMFPMALGIGEGAEVRAPMAIVTIGGLITSTILTLILVPVIYSLLDDLRLFISKKYNKIKTS